MQKRVTLILEPEDVALVKSVSKDPCVTCNKDIIWCRNCLKKMKHTDLVNSIPEESKELVLELANKYRDYTETVKNINKLCEKLDKLTNEYNIDKLEIEDETIYVTQTSDIMSWKLNKEE